MESRRMKITIRIFYLPFFILLLFSNVSSAVTHSIVGVYEPGQTYWEAQAYADTIDEAGWAQYWVGGTSYSDSGDFLGGHKVCYTLVPLAPSDCYVFAYYVNNYALLTEDDSNPNSCPKVKNPIVPTTGNKFHHEKLIKLNAKQPLVFDLFFNNRRIEKWRHSFSRSLNITTTTQLPKYDFIDVQIDSQLHTDPESPGGFGINQVNNNIIGHKPGFGKAAVKFYGTESDACDTGWADQKDNYLSQWASSSSSQYNSTDGKCRIYDENGNLLKTMSIYSRASGKAMKQVSIPYLRFTREDGTVISFQQVGDMWDNINNAGESVVNILDAAGLTEAYLLQTKNNEQEKYDLTGRLISITYVDGYVQTLIYDDVTSQLARVENETGEFIEFSYDVFGDTQPQYRLQQITDHTGRVWGFRYSDAGNIEFIDNPDTTTKQFVYDDLNDAHALTGIIDERGIRYATYAYDDQSRAVSSQHAGNVDYITVQYNEDGSRTATVQRTSALDGAVTPIVTTYTPTPVSGGLLVADISGPGCTSCGSGDVHFEYAAITGYLEFKVEHGIRTEYGSYNIKGNPGFIIEAAGTADARRIDYTYDPRFHDKIATITEPSVFAGSHKVTTYTYDDFGNTTSVTINGFKPDGTAVTRTSNYQYTGPYHQLSQIDGPRSDVSDIIDFEYYSNDASWGNNRARLRNVRSADGNTLRSSISYSATGKIASEYRSNSLYIGYNFEPNTDRVDGMLEYDFTNTYWRITNWTYLPTGEVRTISQAKGSSEENTLTLDYDDARRLTRITDGLGNYIEYILDSEGNVEQENIHDAAGYLKKTLTQTFDSYDRLDNFSETNQVNNLDFNADGTLDKATDSKGQVKDYNYDNLLRLTQVIQDQGGADPTTANALTQYDYDTQDNLTSVTDARGGQTIYVYDDLGNLLSQTSPDTGATAFTHDEAGNIATQTDAKGQLFTYSYDHYNRLTTLDAPGTEDDVSYLYDTCAGGYGKLCSVTRKNSTTGYQYNAMGDVLNIQQGVVSWPGYNQADTSVVYSYDGAGRVKTMTYPSGAVVTYGYDAAGQVRAITLDHNAIQTNLFNITTRFPFGAINNAGYGNGQSYFGYVHNDYRPWIVSGSQQYTTLYYDKNGNPVQMYNPQGQSMLNYDAHDRINTVMGALGAYDYDYDIVGNKTQYIEDGVTNSMGYETNSNRMNSLNTDSVVVDVNGNITSLRGMALGFTADNRLKSANTGVLFEYNGLGQRSMKKVTAPGIAGTYGYSQSVVYLYGLNGGLLAEHGPTGKVVKEYIYMEGKPLAMLDHKTNSGEDFLNGDLDGDGSISVEDFLVYYFNHGSSNDAAYDVNGDGVKDTADNQVMINCGLTQGNCEAASYGASIYYIHNDHLGTPKLMTNELGVAVWRASATPFGKASVNDDVDGDGDSVTLNIRQPGQYYDRETGFYYNYFRYYDPETGRYITSDPIGLAGGINTYAYVENNPLRLIDPLGLYGSEWDFIPVVAWPSIARDAPKAFDAAVQGLGYGAIGVATVATGGTGAAARAVSGAARMCTKENALNALELGLDLMSVIDTLMNPKPSNPTQLIKVYNQNIRNNINRDNEMRQWTKRFPDIHIPRRR